ncbi:MAG: hypothetical protein ACK5JT_21685 [Hyphomicrobiaceae bacterium]
MSTITLAVIARIPIDGVPDFQEYQRKILPLVIEHQGRLERRLRNADGTQEVHILSFASQENYESYRTDPRREAAVPGLKRSRATIEVLRVTDFK